MVDEMNSPHKKAGFCWRKRWQIIRYLPPWHLLFFMVLFSVQPLYRSTKQ